MDCGDQAAVSLALYVGEGWSRQISFYDDPVSDPQTTDDPLALNNPVMGIRQAGYSTLLARLDMSGDLDGVLAVSGGGNNVLTMTLPWLFTYGFQGVGELEFDVFDYDNADPPNRTAIVKSGTITVTDATTAATELPPP